MNLSDIVARYTVVREDVDIFLPDSEEPVMKLRPIHLAPEVAELTKIALEFDGDAVILAQDPETVAAARAFKGNLEYMGRFCTLARAVIGSDTPEDELRLGFLRMAYSAGPWFESVWMQYVTKVHQKPLACLLDAQAGKAALEESPASISDSEQPGMSGESTPTN